MRSAPILCLLPFLPTLAGCPGTTCTTEAVASLQVTVVDASCAAVPDAELAYTVDGVEAPCEDLGGAWVCGWEVSGELTVTATAPGFDAASETVTIESDECHVIGRAIEIVMERADAPRRVFAHSLFATDEECADAQANGVNCYMTLDLCPDGTGAIVVTDIINSGTWVQDGDTITTTWEPGDAPSPLQFVERADGVLEDDAFEVEWDPTDDPTFQLAICD